MDVLIIIVFFTGIFFLGYTYGMKSSYKNLSFLIRYFRKNYINYTNKDTEVFTSIKECETIMILQSYYFKYHNSDENL